ncbi:MAG: (d)CMP kinase [bacterium]|nr:(d)CMP kinase [bacterium]
MTPQSGKDSSGAGIVIPVDGPAGSGKSTMARALADRLGWDYLETGALYRAVGLKVLEAGGSPDDAAEAARQAGSLHFQSAKVAGEWKNLLDDRDVSQSLREERVSDAASRVSSLPEVRAAVLDFQRSYGRERGAVLDGRDIGTVVFPGARLKFFLDADMEVRIQRRFGELEKKGISFDPERLAADLRERDRRDRERKIAPLKPAQDAEKIDTSGMPIDQVLARMLEKVREVYGELIDLPGVS